MKEIAVGEQNGQRSEPVGLTLAEAKALLPAAQPWIVERQTAALRSMHPHGQGCGTPLRTQGHHALTCRTLFGPITRTSPWVPRGSCTSPATATDSPLAALWPERTAPALLFMDTTWASRGSSGLTAQALKDFLPVDARLHEQTGRHHPLAVAPRCEAELRDDQWAVMAGCQDDWEPVPRPDGPIPVGLAGGYVRDGDKQQHHFAVIVGKSLLAFTRDEEEHIPSSKGCGGVQIYEAKPTRRLFEGLQSPGHPMNQQLTFLSDGGDPGRALQRYLHPHAEPIVAWFQVSMRLTGLGHYATGLVHDKQQLGEESRDTRERLQWSLGHGHVSKALHQIADLDAWLDHVEDPDPKVTPLAKTVTDFRPDIELHGRFIPNDGARWRDGEAMATGCMESTVHQGSSQRFCKQQHRPWSRKGAHGLRQTRVKTLTGALGAVVRRGSPDFPVQEAEARIASPPIFRALSD